MTFFGIILLDGLDITDSVLDAITITSGRTNFIDAISPASASGVIMSTALTATTGVGSTIDVSVLGSQRFNGVITNISRGRYHTTWTATSSGLGSYARVNAPDFTVRQIPYSGGLRSTNMSYVALDVLYQAGLLTDAEFLNGADQNIAGLGAVTEISITTTYGSFRIQAESALLRSGATIPAGSVLDQLNFLAGHTRAGTVQEDLRFSPTSKIVFTRQYVEDVIVDPDYVQLDTESTQTLELVANAITVTYGTGSTTSRSDADSAALYGPYSLETTTVYDNILDAAGLAYGLLASRYRPRWLTVPLLIDLKHTGIAYSTYNQLYPGRGWALGNLYSYIPADFIATRNFIEGYTETITASSHIAEVYLYDYTYTNDPIAWADVTPTKTWATAGTYTWYDMIGALL